MLKILQVRLQQYVNWELPDVQAGFRKGRETRGKIANIYWIIEKAKEFQEKQNKTSISASQSTLNPLTVWITKYWEILKEIGILDTLPVSWEPCMQVKKQQLEPDVEQWTGSKLGKEYIKAVYCHPAYSTSIHCVCVCVCTCVCSVMFNSLHPMDCSPAGYSVHGIFQARILEWTAISLSSIQSTSCKMLGWITHELESKLPSEISATSDM